MGWCSATQYVDGCFELVEKYIPDGEKSKIAAKICEMFQAGDWDCEQDSTTYYIALQDDEFLVSEYGRWVDNEEEFRARIIEENEYAFAENPVSEERLERLVELYKKCQK